METKPWQCPEILGKTRQLSPLLHSKIIGQDEALAHVVTAVQAGELGFTHPDRPKASFLFSGPTGVGKTATATAIADHLYGPGHHDHLAVFDMSEFQTQESLPRLLGEHRDDPGLFGERFNGMNGQGVILLDEIEKAHPKIMDLLLQMIDAARITLATRQTLNLSQTYIFCTTNLASSALTECASLRPSARNRFIRAEAERTLRPEIIARFAHFLIYQPLSYEHQCRITKLMLDSELARLRHLGLEITATDQVYDLIHHHGFNIRLGARPLRHAIEHHLRDVIVRAILNGTSPSGRLVVRAAHLEIAQS